MEQTTTLSEACVTSNCLLTLRVYYSEHGHARGHAIKLLNCYSTSTEKCSPVSCEQNMCFSFFTLLSNHSVFIGPTALSNEAVLYVKCTAVGLIVALTKYNSTQKL